MEKSILIVMGEEIKENVDAQELLKEMYEKSLKLGLSMFVEDDKGEGITPYPKRPKS